jgi:outer membrane protein
MSYTPSRFAFFFLIFFFSSLCGWGQTKTVSLKECVGIAMQNSPDIKYAGEDINKTKASYETQKAIARPQVYGKLLTAPGDQRYPKTDQGLDDTTKAPYSIPYFNVGIGIESTYPLYNPAMKGNQIVELKYNDIARLNEKKTRDGVVLAVKRSYYESIAARKNAELQGRMVKNQESRFAQIRALVLTGDRPIVDQSSAEVGLSQSKLDYQRSVNFETQQKAELKSSMGLLLDSTDISLEDFPENYPTINYSINEIYGFLDNSTDMRLAKMQTDTNRIKIESVRNSHYPIVDLFAGTYYWRYRVDPSTNMESQLKNQNTWKPQFGIGFTASVSIWNGGKIESMVDEVKADVNKSLYNEQRTAIKLRKDATNAFSHLAELKQQLEISKLNLENARVNYTLARKSYEGGIRDLRSLQDAELSLLNVEMWMVGAKKDYFQTLALLAYIIGVEEEVLCGN